MSSKCTNQPPSPKEQFMQSAEKKISKLKEKLNQELLKENSDHNIILSISHEIAKLDETLEKSLDKKL